MTREVKIGDKTIVVHGDAEISASNENRHYFWCRYHEQRRCYSVCLSLLGAKENFADRSDDEQSCWKAIKVGACAAASMSQLEKGVGGSVFYSQRRGTLDRPYADGSVMGEPVGVRDLSKTDAYKIGWDRVGASLKNAPRAEKIPESTPVRTKPLRPQTEQPSLADAINRSVAALSANGEEA